MTLKAILFDLGLTLIDYKEPDHQHIAKLEAERLKPLMASYGFMDITLLDQAWRLWREVEERAYRRSLRSLKSPHGPKLLRRVLRDLGFPLTTKQHQEVARAWWLGFDNYGLPPFSDTVDTLQAVKQRGYNIAVINNGSFGFDFFRSDLVSFGMLPYLDVVINSADVGWMKPHPAIFHHALDELGVRPQEVIMVGDLPEFDLRGAKALGITTVWKRNGQDLMPPPEADYTIDSLGEMLDLPVFN